MTSSSRHPLLAATVATLVVAAASASASDTLATLYNFAGTPDGSLPLYVNLVADTSGDLYGTTSTGGANGCGSVFKLSPMNQHTTWAETVLLSFDCNAGGSGPQSGLLLEPSGKLYGTTLAGGMSGAGIVFELAPAKHHTAWTETVLWNFDGTTAASPAGALIRDKAGDLYGTTTAGGASGDGTVFELSPPPQGQSGWTETVLTSFDGVDGQGPRGALVFDKAGNLYGTTVTGGSGAGVVYQLAPPAPNQTGWTETVLLALDATDTGSGPNAGLAMDARGNLYGTAQNGGQNNEGTIFELIAAAPGTRRVGYISAVLHAFAGSDGGLPQDSLVFDKNGNLFGTVATGGPANAGGVFELQPPTKKDPYWTEMALAAFPGSPGGASPVGGILRVKSGAIYGVTAMGGSAGSGTVYSVTP